MKDFPDVATEASRPPIRWWPALVILALGAGALGWGRWAYRISHQQFNIYSGKVFVCTGLALLFWVLFLSRLRWKIRLGIFGTVVVLATLTAGLFKIRGFTGDLLPVLEWRWAKSLNESPALEGASLSRTVSTKTNGPVQSAYDYPQFLGPRRDSTVTGPRLSRDWKAHPPERLWRQPIGAAWSGFVVAGDLAITQEQRGPKECVVCYHVPTGRAVWSHADEARYFNTIAGEGPRATPTLQGNRVFALGATGILNCLDLATGQRLWSKDIIADNQSQVSSWGMSSSPLVIGNHVIVSSGGANRRSLVAYNTDTGEFAWGGGNDGAGYSSPMLTTLSGTRQILIFNAGGIAAHAADTGELLWDYHWRKNHPHITVPLVLPADRVLVSSGYGIGSELLRVKEDAQGKWSIEMIWKSIRLKSKFANLTYLDGHIYGLDDGILVCLDAADGALKWKEGRYGHGQVILTGNLLLIMAENGDVVLVEAVPQEHRELTRFSALRGKTWNPPALAGKHLLVRNDQEAACYRVPVLE